MVNKYVLNTSRLNDMLRCAPLPLRLLRWRWYGLMMPLRKLTIYDIAILEWRALENGYGYRDGKRKMQLVGSDCYGCSPDPGKHGGTLIIQMDFTFQLLMGKNRCFPHRFQDVI